MNQTDFIVRKENDEQNSDTDDFDEFYNDKGFLKTGLYNKPAFGGAIATPGVETVAKLNRVS
jgi:hypothetical protein